MWTRAGAAALQLVQALLIAGFTAAGPLLQPSHRTFYDVPFWTGLSRQMLDRRIGLLASAPIVVLAPFGFVVLWRESRRDAALIACTCALQVASFAKYRLWSESSFGHRFLILTVVLSAVPVCALLSTIPAFSRYRRSSDAQAS